MQDETTNAGPATESPAPAQAPASQPAETPAPSSTSADAQGEKEPSKESLLDVVKAAVEPPKDDEKGEPEGETAEEEEPSEEAKEGEEEDEDQAAEATAREAEGKAKREINRLLRQKRELRSEMEQIRPSAEIGTQLQNFAVQHDLSSDDIVNALHIAATLRRGDYSGFYEMVAPYVRQAQEYLGVVLPEDLQAMVQQGRMAPDFAAQYARERLERQRAELQHQAMGQRAQETYVSNLQGAVAQAVTTLENQFASTDPDWKHKSEMVQRVASAMLREKGGSVGSVDEALEITRAAYNEVNKQVRRFRPQPRATAPQPSSSGAQPSSVNAAPKTLMEAALQGLNKAHAAR